MLENEDLWGTIGMFLLFLVLRFYLIYNLPLTTDQSAYYFYLSIKVKAELFFPSLFLSLICQLDLQRLLALCKSISLPFIYQTEMFFEKNWSWGLNLTVMSTIPFGKLTRMIVYVNELFYNCSFSAQENVVFFISRVIIFP